MCNNPADKITVAYALYSLMRNYILLLALFQVGDCSVFVIQC